ncbi:unnamed protein product [Vicia faba]|uniref:Uncharacterized protein n=1 Tax=Vicia faba TaxID=3906 RepID=A0AAV0ZBC7_VICFA|nr:unnamed protein product [Vicia faba]
MKRTMKNLTKSHEKDTQEKDHMVNNVSDNIDDVIDYSFSSDKGFIPMNNKVHNGSKSVNKGVTKYVGLCKSFGKKSNKIVDGNTIPTNGSIGSLYNVCFHYEKSVLKRKYLYHKWVALKGSCQEKL